MSKEPNEVNYVPTPKAMELYAQNIFETAEFIFEEVRKAGKEEVAKVK